jgi:uncharacterized Zn finger protein
VAERQATAAREALKLAEKGEVLCPVRSRGRTIASTFWGKAWCTNLEMYSDYANRLPRGRSYLSSGQVLDLRVAKGRVTSRVMGTQLYTVTVSIDRVEPTRWNATVKACAGQVGSMIELLQGKLSKSVMEAVTQPRTGLFPSPAEIHLQCSCPDWASMCKHVAATLYGVGARLDDEPELLFVLRGVDPAALVVDSEAARTATDQAKDKALGADAAELADLFGIDMVEQDRGAAIDSAPQSGLRRRRAANGDEAKVPTAAAKATQPTVEASPKPPTSAKSSRPKRQLAPHQPVVDTTLVTKEELDSRDIDDAIRAYWMSAGLLAAGPRKGTWLATEECMRRIKRCALKSARGPGASKRG